MYPALGTKSVFAVKLYDNLSKKRNGDGGWGEPKRHFPKRSLVRALKSVLKMVPNPFSSLRDADGFAKLGGWGEAADLSVFTVFYHTFKYL